MSQHAGAIAGVVILLAIGVSAFIALSERIFPFSESLQREDSLNEEVGGSSSSVSLRFHDDSDDVRLASEARVTELDVNRYRLSIRTSHTNGAETELDSLALRLNVGRIMPEVALRTPGGNPWEPIHFQRTDDGQGVMLNIPDLGVQGTGTVSLEFLVGPYEQDAVPESLWLDFDARLHREGWLNLTAYAADSLVEVPMPDESP